MKEEEKFKILLNSENLINAERTYSLLRENNIQGDINIDLINNG